MCAHYLIYADWLTATSHVPYRIIYRIETGTRLDPKVAKFWAVQVALAFEYLHNVDVVFRDLKPENLLVDYRSSRPDQHLPPLPPPLPQMPPPAKITTAITTAVTATVTNYTATHATTTITPQLPPPPLSPPL